MTFGLRQSLIYRLQGFRIQQKAVPEINPILWLARAIDDLISRGEVQHKDLNNLLLDVGEELWSKHSKRLARKAGLDKHMPQLHFSESELNTIDLSKPLYGAVLTAHPVFSRNYSALQLSAKRASGHDVNYNMSAHEPRKTISLSEEHNEAMAAIINARDAIMGVTFDLLTKKQKRDVLPKILSTSTWVGYDLDGRDDISWIDSFQFRLQEKHMSLGRYLKACQKYPELGPISQKLEKELKQTRDDLDRFAKIPMGEKFFLQAVNGLTERKEKLTASSSVAEQILAVAKQIKDDRRHRKILTIAGDVACHGFGMGRIHLRINSANISNTMSAIFGRSLQISEENISTRTLVGRLASIIESESAWSINFLNLDQEIEAARRQFMLAAQILKHIDSDQPIRLLIAECEQPITILSALYLARKFGVEKKLDISPLFETAYGLQHGAKILEQLCQIPVYRNYVGERRRLAVQTGFSDAGRFMGQIAANLAIERLQLKIAQLVNKCFQSQVELLIFNTHGESLGRGGTSGTPEQRQNFVLTPFVRAQCRKMGLPLHHETSFQGGDGFQLFGTSKLAVSMISHLLYAEIKMPCESAINDPYYKDKSFSLDMFLAIKAWHDRLYHDNSYFQVLEMFGSNMLTLSGSRPTKRADQKGAERRDPSQIRAIPHNGILQQLGFAANVISGFATGLEDIEERFCEIFSDSARLKQLLHHVLAAEALGSLDSLRAYGQLLDKNFWIDSAFWDKSMANQGNYLRVAKQLKRSTKAESVRTLVATLLEDQVKLSRLVSRLNIFRSPSDIEDRMLVDLLHSLRIALTREVLAMFSSLLLVAKSEKVDEETFMESALQLDFTGAIKLIREDFSPSHCYQGKLAECTTYKSGALVAGLDFEQQFLIPIQKRVETINRVSMLISAHYDAHG